MRRQDRAERPALAFQPRVEQRARGDFRADRQFRDRDLRRGELADRRFGFERRGVRAGWTDHCPPGLVATGAQCIPPGQFRRQQAAAQRSLGWADRARLGYRDDRFDRADRYDRDGWTWARALPVRTSVPLLGSLALPFGYGQAYGGYSQYGYDAYPASRYDPYRAYGYDPYRASRYAPAYSYGAPYGLYQPAYYGPLDYGYGYDRGGMFGGGDSGLLGTLIAVVLQGLLGGGSGGLGDLGLLSSVGGLGGMGGLGGGYGGYGGYAPYGSYAAPYGSYAAPYGGYAAPYGGYGSFAAYDPNRGYDLGYGNPYGDPGFGLGGLGDLGLLSSLGGLGGLGGGRGGFGGDSLITELVLGALLGGLI